MVKDLYVVSWNIDGIERTFGPRATASPTKRTKAARPGSHMSLRELHHKLGGPDVLALQELRIRSVDTDLVAKLAEALPGYECGYSLPRDPLNVRFRGGRAYGVATYVRRALEPRWLDPPAWDREGRVIAVELPEHNLLLTNVYAVNGTDKPYFDPDSGKPSGDRHVYKRRFLDRLQIELSEGRARGFKLVLVGDWNVSRTAMDTHPRLRTEAPHAAARAQLNDAFMPSLEVEDVFREEHPKAREYSWFNRVAVRYGRLDAARVDYFLTSRALRASVVSATILQDQALKLGSDHAPITLRLSL
jgi:exodeoxyribonuclease-3